MRAVAGEQQQALAAVIARGDTLKQAQESAHAEELAVLKARHDRIRLLQVRDVLNESRLF